VHIDGDQLNTPVTYSGPMGCLIGNPLEYGVVPNTTSDG